MKNRTCNACDWHRCIISYGETSAPKTTKKERTKQLYAHYVCILPESKFYGQKRSNKDPSCPLFYDWFSMEWEKPEDLEARQTALVTKCREEKFGLPYNQNIREGASLF